MRKNLKINRWSNLEVDLVDNEKVGKIHSQQMCYYDFETFQNFRSWDCISLDVYLPDDRPIEFVVGIYPLAIGRHEFIEKTSAKVSLIGKGWKNIQIFFNQFDYLHTVEAFWSFISGIAFEHTFISNDQSGILLIKNICLQKTGNISITSLVTSKAGKAGDQIIYEIDIENLTDKDQMVSISQEWYGKESMKSLIEPNSLYVRPYEKKVCQLLVEIDNNIAPGGFETQKLTFIPNGEAAFAKNLEFITSRELPHPYILHTEEGWSEVQEKVKKYDWAKSRLNEYRQIAESWVIPEPNEGEYLFETSERHNITSAAIAWKLTGESEFAKKAAIFLRKLSDPSKGYESIQTPLFTFIESYSEYKKGCPMMHMACNQGLVQEAEFFRDMAISYDLIFHSDFLSDKDHQNIEKTFRSYIAFADYLLTDGDGNNFQVCEMTAGLFCSMAIQDRKWMNRFIYGYNGFADLLGSVMLDDGWYFEVATSYIKLASELLTETVQAALPWGINLKDLYVAPSYHSNIMLSPWSMKKEKPFLGMSFAGHGANHKNYRTLRQYYDSMIPFLDHRGVMFGMNDSTEHEYHDLYERAYYLFRNDQYVPIINSNKKRRNLLYGVPELPEVSTYKRLPSTFVDNAGFAVLRSQTESRSQNEQIQAVLKYGIHGGYHGHFDRMSLLSLMRYGRSFYNPEATWYGYGSYLFKMWVQASMSHNMVVVDQKMQEPTEGKRLLFHEGELFQACAVEVHARWSDPPYGGQTPYPRTFPEEKGWDEGRSISVPEKRRKQGDIGEYTDSILQRRLMIVTDDYIIINDYLRGNEEHEFDCLYHIKGFKAMEAQKAILKKHTGQFNQDVYGAGQFITNCDWYEVESPALFKFEDESESQGEENLKINLHRVWPAQGKVILGNYPENKKINKKVSFEVLGDGKVLQSGKSGVWILGKQAIDVNVKSIKQIEIRCQIEENENKLKTLFIGDPYFITSTGKVMYVSDLTVEFENVNQGHGIGKSYYGSDVVIEGIRYQHAIPFEPMQIDRTAKVKVNVENLDVERFVATIGGDYPVDDQHRKTVSFRTDGTSTHYITVLEPFNEEAIIKEIKSINKEMIVVKLNNGKTHEVMMRNVDGDGHDISIELAELNDGAVIRTEYWCEIMNKCT